MSIVLFYWTCSQWTGLFLWAPPLPLAELAGGQAKALPERPDKVVGVPKAALEGYLRDGQVRVLQQLLGVGEAVEQQILLGAVAHLLLNRWVM